MRTRSLWFFPAVGFLMASSPLQAVLRLSAVLLLTAGAFPLQAQTPAHFWSQRFGDTSSDVGYAVAVDGSGNVFVTGYFAGTVNFGGGNLVSAGSIDIFLAKYNANGVHQWSKRFGSTSFEEGSGVAVDPTGSVIVTGYFAGTVDFGGGGLVSAGGTDIFVAKYSPDGSYLWSQRFGGTSSDFGTALAVDASYNVVVTGHFEGTVDFGGGSLASAGAQDIFLAQYDYFGDHLWSKRFGSTDSDFGHAVAVDGSGNVVVTGFFKGTVDFGGGGLASAGASDIFLAKYDYFGVHQWSRRFGSTDNDGGEAVAIDGSGNVVVTGYFAGTVGFGGSSLVSAGASDIFLAKYNAGGVHQWSQRFGSAFNDVGYGVAVSGSGQVVVTGYFYLTANFGGGNLVSAGYTDIVLARYNANGVHQWSQRFGSTNDDIGYAVAVDGSGHTVVTGWFSWTVNFGGGGLVGAGSAGSPDIFLAKYAAIAAEPLITSIVDIDNDQGRRVRIGFSRSGHDDASALSSPIVSYEAYRRNDAVSAAIPGEGLSSRQLLDLGWVFAGAVPAHLASDYLMDAPTDADSTIANGMHTSVFFIRAAARPAAFFDSPSDSGYSLDNLAPGVPQGFVYGAGILNWVESTATDFDYFTVYGSSASSFGSSTLIDYTVSPTLSVNASPYTYYFVTATDFSGNEGKPAVINAASDVGDPPVRYVLSVSSYPNPFNPSTTVKYTVPARGRVAVAIYDAAGAHVLTLVDGDMPAGAYTMSWDGRDHRGNGVTSGVYFARVSQAGQTKSYKMVLLK